MLFKHKSSTDELCVCVGLVKSLTVIFGAEDEHLPAQCSIIVYSFALLSDLEEYFELYSARSHLPHLVLQTDDTATVSVHDVTECVTLLPMCFWQLSFQFLPGYFVVDGHQVGRDADGAHLARVVTSPVVRARWAALTCLDTGAVRETV